MCLAQGPQRSDAGEARTRDPSVSSQATEPLRSLHYRNDKSAVFTQIIICISSLPTR